MKLNLKVNFSLFICFLFISCSLLNSNLSLKLKASKEMRKHKNKYAILEGYVVNYMHSSLALGQKNQISSIDKIKIDQNDYKQGYMGLIYNILASKRLAKDNNIVNTLTFNKVSLHSNLIRRFLKNDISKFQEDNQEFEDSLKILYNESVSPNDKKYYFRVNSESGDNDLTFLDKNVTNKDIVLIITTKLRRNEEAEDFLAEILIDIKTIEFK